MYYINHNIYKAKLDMPILSKTKDKVLELWPNSDFYILDVEYTSWQGSLQSNWSKSDQWREIIEIGSIYVKLVNDNYEVASDFNCFIRPILNPVLSNYIIELTGITQNKIDILGKSIKDISKDLNSFFDKNVPIIFNGDDGEVFRDNCIINNLEYPDWLSRAFNFRPLLSSNLKKDQSILISSQLPKISQIEDLHSHHSAIGDCKSILNALEFWRKKGLLL